MKSSIVLLLSILLGYSAFSQNTFDTFFQDADQFFAEHVDEGLIDYQAINDDPASLRGLVMQIATASVTDADAATRQAFYINTYNLLVVAQVIEHYPLDSPLSVSGFFDRTTYLVAGEELTLNQLEKDKLLKTYEDVRFHFVLVCGALDCPPIIAGAYWPLRLEAQLEGQTQETLNDPNFVREDDGGTALSQIFEWYADDFGGSKAKSIEFINRYRNAGLNTKNVSFYSYDWSLNQQAAPTGKAAVSSTETAADGNNATRYVVSATVPKGTFEIKGFSNLYNQLTGNGEDPAMDQATFFTQNLSVLYGVNNRFNAGIDLRYRQVSFGSRDDSRFAVFNLEQTANTRQGLTGIGPKIRYAPSAALPNFSIQSTYWFATESDLAGTSERPFIDFNGDIWFTQLFNDIPLGDNFSLFTELDILWEDIGAKQDGHINRFSTPVQAIFSYFPNPKTTLYTIGSYSPYWQENFDYFYQVGLGAKYQFTPKLELELLYTQFRNQFIRQTKGTASTLNIGVRISVF